MRNPKFESLIGITRSKSVQILVLISLLYLILVTYELPFLENDVVQAADDDASFSQRRVAVERRRFLDSEEDLEEKSAPVRPLNRLNRLSPSPESDSYRIRDYKGVSGLKFDLRGLNRSEKDGFSGIHRTAIVAFEVGERVWEDLVTGKVKIDVEKVLENRSETCVSSVSYTGDQIRVSRGVVELPCGLGLGSHITVVGKPRARRATSDRRRDLAENGDWSGVGFGFEMELIGLKTVDGEEPPRVLHLNPRLKGDWSGMPVIELNTCYRQQWGRAQRCEGWKSGDDEETVDGFSKCEKWNHGSDDDDDSGQTKATWWLNRLTGRAKKVTVDWSYPFVEDKLFVLTLSAGLEGYHITVDGRHITSFPYRTGFSLEDATGLTVKGDVNVHSVFAASLPSSHPSFAPQKQLEMSSKWQAPPLPDGPVELFVGILSAANHFAERMAVRKSWMQDELITSSEVVARFFVALHSRKEVNIDLKKEADFFGDIVIVPYIDAYDLVVLKTIAICEYGVRTVSAKNIMKCDDDTFVHVNALVREARKIPDETSFYVGNINYYHQPLRTGKWAVTYEEWPEEDYPPYANGPGYILSSDIANYIVNEFEKHRLKLFKMEDVSMGMWVEKFNASTPVEYLHSLKFCQFGCIEDYHTAHYQSPKQMLCLWNKLQQFGRPICCNGR